MILTKFYQPAIISAPIGMYGEEAVRISLVMDLKARVAKDRRAAGSSVIRMQLADLFRHPTSPAGQPS